MTDENKVVIIAPDHGSGITFSDLLEKLGVKARQADYIISPRVEGEGITPNVLVVANDLAKAILAEITKGVDIITIACNTLSLPIFTNLVLELIEEKIEDSLPSFELILTIPQIKEYVQNNNNKKIIVLGTLPLSKILAQTENVPTPANYEEKENLELLRLVQEIIWRVKAVQGSDTSTAPIYKEAINDENVLRKKLEELNNLLETLDVEEVIMSCTELPDAFQILTDCLGTNTNYKLIDPATLVASAIKQRQ